MPYPPQSDLNAVRMDSSTESLFLDKLKYLVDNSIDKNRDWWPVLLERYKTHFDSWYLTFHKNDIVAFSAVQLFDNNWVRLCTRMWNGIKKTGLERGVILNEVSPALLMIELQLEDYKDKKHFMSMEYANRTVMMEKFAIKLEHHFGGGWKLNDGMYFTCPDYPSCREDPSCWQNIVSKDIVPFDKINTLNYLEQFKGKRKRKSNIKA